MGISAERVADVAIEAKVMLIPAGKGQFVLGAALEVELPSIDDPGLAVELARRAHESCPYSKATRGNIDVAFTANGLAVSEAHGVAA
jgi:osmotically inducible protein OsmC